MNPIHEHSFENGRCTVCGKLTPEEQDRWDAKYVRLDEHEPADKPLTLEAFSRHVDERLNALERKVERASLCAWLFFVALGIMLFLLR